MSAWPEAAWIVHQINKEYTKGYNDQIVNLATSVASWENNVVSNYDKKFAAITSTSAPSGSIDDDLYSNGTLCFIIEEK